MGYKKFMRFIEAMSVRFKSCAPAMCFFLSSACSNGDSGDGEQGMTFPAGTEQDGGGSSSDDGLGETMGTDTDESGSVSSSEEGEADTGSRAQCGDGVLQPGELCDDGNAIETDACTSLCKPPSCEDGLVSGDETDTDCGGSCQECGVGAACGDALDCTSSFCDSGVCQLPASCAELHESNQSLEDGVYTIAADDGRGLSTFEVFCDMTTDGGGWTLVMTSSDDGVNTWTWENRELMGTDPTFFGSLSQANRDYKSPAYNLLPFYGLLFRHAPSGMWAAYGAVGAGNLDLGSFVEAQDSPMCGLDNAGYGYTMTAGNLVQGGGLCDSDLYFNLGDHDGWLPCEANVANGTYGPGWSVDNNNGCPFDDPGSSALGPMAPCTDPCEPAEGTDGAWIHTLENRNQGFGKTLGLNQGAPGAAENYMQVFIR